MYLSDCTFKIMSIWKCTRAWWAHTILGWSYTILCLIFSWGTLLAQLLRFCHLAHIFLKYKNHPGSKLTKNQTENYLKYEWNAFYWSMMKVSIFWQTNNKRSDEKDQNQTKNSHTQTCASSFRFTFFGEVFNASSVLFGHSLTTQS